MPENGVRITSSVSVAIYRSLPAAFTLDCAHGYLY